ncbi:MAG: response regulator [Anaerolineae bacterium]|nr:response regulator [Anaerolineae bacterium]
MAERILVVDDDLDSLKLIGLMLQRNGYEVSAANTGAQALTRAMAEHPDLIILDVMMPDMNGYEVCRRLRLNVETKGIPIIMFTAKTLIDDKVAGFEAGADDYLTKPTHPAELASRVKAILQRTAQRRHQANMAPTIGVVGAKGGVGVTTLALNMAAARVLAGENAIIADFRPGLGTIGLSLGFPQSQGMANVLQRPHTEILPRLVEAELVSHASGLRGLLSSAQAQETQINLSAEAMVAALRCLRQLGRPVIIDLGSGYTPLVSNLQRELDHLLMVIDTNPITSMMAREQLNELHQWSGNDAQRVSVVAVQHGQQGKQLAWQDLERIVGLPIRAAIAPSADLILQAVQARVTPVTFQPGAAFSNQVIKLAEEVSVKALQASQQAVLE